MRRPAALVAALALAACAPQASLPTALVAGGPGITIRSAPVPLNPENPGQAAIGAFTYAGGLVLTSGDTSRMHGLSDLRILPGGRLISVSDEGDILEARLVLDKAGRLTGLTDGRMHALTDLEGKPLQGKEWADSEGLAVLPDGDVLVSFERHDRIWLYPRDGSLPRAVPSPDASFPLNSGMEALAADPDAGPDAYLTGGEESGQTWTCRLSAKCAPGPTIEKPPEFGLVAAARLPAGETAYLLRAWDPLRGSRITLKVLGPQGEVARMDLARPLSVDNFEGLAAVPATDGSVRFYLISDDNFQSIQRTLLFAFDWKPPRT